MNFQHKEFCIRHWISCLTILLLVSGCDKKNLDHCDDTQPLFGLSGFPIGVAVDVPKLRYDNQYRDIVHNQFNSLTPENILKFENIHPAEAQYEWAEMDHLIEFAQSGNKRVHGHTLIWHKQLPVWLLNHKGNKEDWLVLMRDHIFKIMTRYKGKVQSWDVVNEAFNEDGTLRHSIWNQKIGPGYIEQAFLFAHQADKDALLFYNDFNLALNANKRKAVLKLITTLKSKNVPIHGIGMQMHVFDGFPSQTEINTAAIEFQKLGLKIHFSELDISLNPLANKQAPTNKMLGNQKRKIKMIVLNYQQLGISSKFGITVWGVSDIDSWIPANFNRMDWPLLYDDEYQTKPMYCGFKEGLLNK
ncbi:endo-1,4-beta-xylanase [Fulvivirgaceae bacterium BMA10]|uniref:Beta-xylanase n=1 Tax=Splendidivirga corallicola TaxID=3051826 RepID=A0ABT8KK72_9BACT|nr:endo-1,4-beta-xylanase [Fulvivirgaceae bacterium BMA10]